MYIHTYLCTNISIHTHAYKQMNTQNVIKMFSHIHIKDDTCIYAHTHIDMHADNIVHIHVVT